MIGLFVLLRVPWFILFMSNASPILLSPRNTHMNFMYVYVYVIYRANK